MPLASKTIIMLGVTAASMVGNPHILRVHCLAMRPALHRPLITTLPSPSLKQALTTARYMTSSSDNDGVNLGISRLATLQTMLSKAGAPGSKFCSNQNDLQPIPPSETNNIRNLHPHLFPIAQSKSSPSHYICGLRRAYADDAEYESSTNAPWPIVESTLNGPGYNLLALNTEHIMRRIAAEADSDGNDGSDGLIQIYNAELGQGALPTAFDQPYPVGDVEKLGYGPSKYILLRVGAFPDLYSEMTASHLARDDESSALIAAEAANGKFVGFGSTFASYARVLAGLEGRDEEARDAARMCLRLPIPSAGLDDGDFVEIACLAQLCEDGGDVKGGMDGLKGMYDKIKEHEKEDDATKNGMSKEQMAIEEANALLDSMSFDTEDRSWESIRGELSNIYADAGMVDMAEFVDSGYA